MKKLFLFLSLNSKDVFVGTLSSNFAHGNEVFMFEFSDEYLLNKNYPIIDPLLFYFSGPQYDFHFLNDMAPDRFGTILIDKYEQVEALKNNRPVKKLTLSDYLVRVSDLSRMGALRIKEKMDGPFLNDDSNNAIPPYVYLRDIEYASIKLEEDNDIDNDVYRRLLLPGSSLGGARPKASVYISDDVYLAKFPSRNDGYDVELWEYITLEIARKLGLDVPKTKLDKFFNYGHTLLVKRFDRDKSKRIHYISAVTALGTTDGSSGQYSYLDLANFINSNCVDVRKNLIELYKRMVFIYLINNTDNHLRNHAFIYRENGYELSPLFDVNPSLYNADFELSFGNGNTTNGLISVSKYFYIDEESAKEIINDFKNTIINEINKYISIYPKIRLEASILLKIIERK